MLFNSANSSADSAPGRRKSVPLVHSCNLLASSFFNCFLFWLAQHIDKIGFLRLPVWTRWFFYFIFKLLNPQFLNIYWNDLPINRWSQCKSEGFHLIAPETCKDTVEAVVFISSVFIPSSPGNGTPVFTEEALLPFYSRSFFWCLMSQEAPGISPSCTWHQSKDSILITAVTVSVMNTDSVWATDFQILDIHSNSTLWVAKLS